MKFGSTIIVLMLLCQVVFASNDNENISKQQNEIWQAAKTVYSEGNCDSALVLTRRLLSLTDVARWDTISFNAHKMRAEIRMSRQDVYDWQLYNEYAYFSHYPVSGPMYSKAQLLSERILDKYNLVASKRREADLPTGAYVSEIHESDKEIQNSKLLIGSKRHKDLPFFSFIILENDKGELIAKITDVCGVSRDLNALDIYSGKYNEFITEAPLMKNDRGGYLFEISTQKVKESHTSTANMLSGTGAEFNKAGRDAIDSAPAGNTTEKLAASAGVALISGLFDFGASLARKGYVNNQMVSVELYPKGNGRVEVVFKRVDYIVDQNNDEKTHVMNKVFDCYLLQPHHEPWFFEKDNGFFLNDMATFHPADENIMSTVLYYCSLPYIGNYDKKGKWKETDATKLNRRSMARLLASEYLSCIDADDPAMKYVPELDKLLSFTTEQSDYPDDSWKRSLYNVYLGDYNTKKRWFKSFFIKKHGNDMCVFYSPDNWNRTYVSIYDFFHNTLVIGEMIGGTVANYEIVRNRKDGFEVSTELPFKSIYP